MNDHELIYSGIEGASPGRFAALVTKHEVVTFGKARRGTCPGSRPCARRRDVRLPDSGRTHDRLLYVVQQPFGRQLQTYTRATESGRSAGLTYDLKRTLRCPR